MIEKRVPSVESSRPSRSAVAALFVTLALLAIMNLLHPWKRDAIEWDVTYYYSYLPAAIIHHDLTLAYVKPGMVDAVKVWPVRTAEGRLVIRTTLGLALLYLPFFLIAHALAPALAQPANGYSWPYTYFLVLGSVCYASAGVWLLRGILLRYFSEATTAITLVAMTLGTNLLLYATQNAMPHAYDFFLITAFLRLCMDWHERPTATRSVLLGLVSGLIVLVRPVNALVLVLFPLYAVRGRSDLADRLGRLRRSGASLALLALAALAVFVPQVLYWWHVTGHPLVWTFGGQRFFLDRPHVVQGFVGFRKGLFLYVPLTLFAIAGLAILPRRAPAWGWWPALLMLPFVWVTMSWWCWWYGGGLSIRPFVDLYGLWALGLAALVEGLRSSARPLRATGLALVALAAAYGTWVNYQYLRGVIHNDGMNASAWRYVQFRRDPGRVGDLITRPDYDRAFYHGDVEK
jgi:hypothetical protein